MLFQRKTLGSPLSERTIAGGPFRVLPEARASIDPEGITFFHLSSGIIFRANPIAARIWRGAVENQTVATIAAEIASEYGVPLAQVERDTAAFLADLKAHKFVDETKGN